MDDKQKDLQNEQEKAATDLKVEFKPSGEKTEPFVVKKTPTQIKIENSQNVPQPNSLDINANLGSFGPSDTIPVETPVAETTLSAAKVSTLEKIQEKNDQLPAESDKNTKIDFEKFERRKNVKIKTKFGIKIDG
jgi:hypothetical protein